MEWAKPEYGKKAVDRAGRALVSPETTAAERAEALTIVNNWRSSHSFPLNTLQMSLRKKARSIEPSALVAQRTKRLPSIRMKLERFPNMKLSQMHDLGGGRAVMSSLDAVRGVESSFLKSRHKHTLSRHDDYIESPKPSGYRGIHLVYKYQSDRSDTYNGLRIEIQIRSSLMHSWATTVETVGTFTKQSLKSSRGDEDFLRFFLLMSAHISNIEGTPMPPGVPANIEAVNEEIGRLASQLNFVERLEAYQRGLQEITAGEKGSYALLQLDIKSSTLVINTYKSLSEASAAFNASEMSDADGSVESSMKDSVLVAVDAMNTLRSAYPNYFLDTTGFLNLVKEITSTHPTKE